MSANWLRTELRRIKELQEGYLNGSEPVFWHSPGDNALVIVSTEEDDDPEFFWIMTGTRGTSLNRQVQVDITEQPEYSKAGLREQGFIKMKNPYLKEIWEEVAFDL